MEPLVVGFSVDLCSDSTCVSASETAVEREDVDAA
jgi:hypothetical protein